MSSTTSARPGIVESAPSPKQNASRWMLVASAGAALLLALLADGVNAVRVIRYGLPLGWDEAQHAMESLAIADTLHRGDLGAFLRVSNEQVFYPPVNSWFQALTFLVWQPDDTTARYANMVGLVLLAAATWTLAVLMTSRYRWAAGLIAVALLVASPLTLGSARESMDEIVASLMVVTSLALLVRAEQTRSRSWSRAAALAVLLACLTKYDYAAFLVVAVLLNHAIEGRFRPSRLAETFADFYRPLLFGLSLWVAFGFSQKVQTIVGFGVSQAVNTHQPLWQVVLYYPSVVVGGNPFGLLGVLLVLLGLLAYARSGRLRGDRLLWLFLVIALLLLTIHPNKQQRLIMPVLPVLWAMAAAGIARAESLRGRGSVLGRRYGQVAVAAASALAVALAGIAFARVRPVSAGDLARAHVIHETIRTIAETVNRDQPAFVVGTFADLGPFYVTWGLRSAWRRPTIDVATDYALLPYPGPLPRSGADPAPSPAYARIWRRWRSAHRADWIVTLAVGHGSPFWTGDYGTWNAWKLNYVAAVAAEEPAPVRTLISKRFAFTVRIYAPLPAAS